MPGTSEETLREVIKFLWENQTADVDGESENYISNIADELGTHEDTIRRALKFMEDLNLVTSWREGTRKCYRITWDLSKEK